MDYLIADLRRSLGSWRFWLLFGTHDAYAPMRRTRFGPLFYTLQNLLRTTIIFIVFGPSIAPGSVEYFGYVAIGLPLFGLYSAAVTSGYSILSRNKVMLENGKIPFLACILRFFVDSSVRLAFALLVYVGFVALYPSTLTLNTLLVIPGIVIAIVFVFAVALVFMVVAAFFPDLSEAVNAVMALMLFATPVFWHAEDRHGIRRMLADVNPLTHLLAIVREPALGKAPETFSYIYACSVTALLVIASVWLFSVVRNWIIFKL